MKRFLGIIRDDETVRGWFVVGGHTSVAWFGPNDRAEAEKLARQYNWRGGDVYRVEPDTRPLTWV